MQTTQYDILNYVVLYVICTVLLYTWAFATCYTLFVCAVCYKMGVAAICYSHFSGFCYMLCTIKLPLLYAIINPLGPYLLSVSMILGSIK